MGSLVQGGGWNQNAHLALVRALSHGTPIVEGYVRYTGDLAEHDGHIYVAKAPGVALLTVGPYFVLDRSGALDGVARLTGVPRDDVDVWALTVMLCMLAAAVTLVLVWLLGDDVAPGYGVAAAVTLGLGTLFLPFATLLFAHVPAAAFGFAAFAVLWRRRGVWAVFGAGVLAGLAMTIEYPLAIAAAGLGLYAISEGGIVKRGVAYGAGALVGLSPLLAYNTWAFGSPLHFPYEDALPIYGAPSNERGLFGISWPSLHAALSLLGGERGLLTITPVVLCGVAALIPMYRRGHRREALLIGAVTLAYFVYNTAYDVPFGGDSPGPRFLIATLPYLAVPLALSWQLWPWPTALLAVPSVVYAVGVTVTGPLQAFGWEWIHDRGGATTAEQARFLPLAAAAIVLAVVATRRGSRACVEKPSAS
jgi:hypothetical protein